MRLKRVAYVLVQSEAPKEASELHNLQVGKHLYDLSNCVPHVFVSKAIAKKFATKYKIKYQHILKLRLPEIEQ